MINYISNGNIFDSQMQTLVNPVNCVGVMGKGLALEFKKRYPMMFQDYVKRCRWGDVVCGKSYVWELLGNKQILNFPTKDHYNENSKLEYIEFGLRDLLNMYQCFSITSIAFPKLGCGLGGLDWDRVKPSMEFYLNRMNIDIEIYL